MQTTFSAQCTPGSIRDHYDQFAWAYRLYWGDHIHHGFFRNGTESPAEAQVLMLRHCARQAGVLSGSIIADVGCGHGGTTCFLAREYRCRVLGITNSPTQVKLAQKLHGTGPVKFELADAEAYRFLPSSFDLVWCMESTEHFFDKPSWFRKAAAALKPGGRLMVAAWTGSMQHELIQNIARVFLCPELLTAEQYIEQIEDAGLRIISREQLASEVAPTWAICAQHVHQAGPLLSFLPHQFHEFAQGIELMRQGYRTGQLGYSVIVAEKR